MYATAPSSISTSYCKSVTRFSWDMDADIDWHHFDASKTDTDTIRIIKAAALVEANAPDYVAYLCSVWHDDAQMQIHIKEWGAEESQHGRALAKWAKLADPQFDFEAALAAFARMQAIDVGAAKSIRGSRAGELIARCVVESGTSSMYSAISAACDEPVLKQLTRRIAADEFAHYTLFFGLLKKHGGGLSQFSRLKIALSRLFEAGDDELASAYYCAGLPQVKSYGYNRKACSNAWLLGVMRLYQRRHINRLVAMVARAGGLAPNGIIARICKNMAWIALHLRKKMLLRSFSQLLPKA